MKRKRGCEEEEGDDDGKEHQDEENMLKRIKLVHHSVSVWNIVSEIDIKVGQSFKVSKRETTDTNLILDLTFQRENEFYDHLFRFDICKSSDQIFTLEIILKNEDSYHRYYDFNEILLYYRNFELNPENKIVEFVRNQIKKFIRSRPCDHLFLEEYESTKYLEIECGELFLYPHKNQIMGSIVCLQSEEFGNIKYAKALGCEGYVLQEKYHPNPKTEACKKMETRLRRSKKIVRPVLSKIRSLKKEVDNQRDFLKVPIVQNIRKALESGKLFEGQNLYKTLNDQVTMCQKDPYHVKSRDYPHTLRKNITKEIRGKNREKNWSKDSGKWIFHGDEIELSKYQKNKILELFRYYPGIQDHLMELVFKVLDSLGCEYVLFTRGGDGMYNLVCVEMDESDGFQFWIGVEDYGASNSTSFKLMSIIEKSVASLEKSNDPDKEKKINILKSVSLSVLRHRQMENSSSRVAKEFTMTGIHGECKIKNSDDTIFLFFPLYFYFHFSMSGEFSKATTLSSITYILHQIEWGKENGYKCCQKMILDSTIWDGCSGTYSFTNSFGVVDPSLRNYEIPYYFEIPLIKIVKDPQSTVEKITVELVKILTPNDIEHLEKERRNRHICSTGGGGTLYVWLTACDSSDGNYMLDEEKKKYFVDPITWRVYEFIYREESSNPMMMRLSNCTGDSVYPSDKQKHKTKYVSMIYSSRTDEACRKYLKMINEGTIFFGSSQPRKNEFRGNVSFSSDFRSLKNKFLSKRKSTETDLKYVVSMLQKLRYYLTLPEKVKIVKHNNLLPKPFVAKYIRCCMVYIDVFEKYRLVGVGFKPYRVFCTNVYEKYFMDMRYFNSNYSNPTLKEVIRRIPLVFLKKQDIVFRRSNSYSYEEDSFDFSDVLLSEDILLFMEDVREKTRNEYKTYLKNLKLNIVKEPRKEDFDQNRNYFGVDHHYREHFFRRISIMIKACCGLCRKTSRYYLIKEGFCFLTEDKRESITSVLKSAKQEVKDLFIDIDLYLTYNISDSIMFRCFTVIHEILRSAIEVRFKRDFEKIFNSLSSSKSKVEDEEEDEDEDEDEGEETVSQKIFKMLVKKWVEYRVLDVIDLMNLNKPNDVNCFRVNPMQGNYAKTTKTRRR